MHDHGLRFIVGGTGTIKGTGSVVGGFTEGGMWNDGATVACPTYCMGSLIIDDSRVAVNFELLCF
jgi:hypothetical protein